MDRRQLLLGMTALGLARNLTLPGFLDAQNVETGDSLLRAISGTTSDRERDGLRGFVKMAVVEAGSDSRKTSTTTEYDFEGRLLASRSAYSGGSEWENTRTYDAEGRLLRATNKSDHPSSMQIYSYDERGRLLSITDSNGPRTDFHYDSDGRKTETQTIPARPGESQAVAVGMGAMFGSIEEGYALNDGGTVSRRYDDHDLLVESQVLDSEGNLVTRIIRNYDSKGRLTSERMIPENWDIGVAKQMLANEPEEYRTEEVLKQIRAQLKTMLKAVGRDKEKSYTYDAQNQISETHMQSSLWNQDTTITYNDQGDIIEQRETSIHSSPDTDFRVVLHQDEAGNLAPDKPQSEWPAQPDLLPRSTVIRYTYEYDSQGNWTEQTTILQDGPTSTIRRKLTYY